MWGKNCFDTVGLLDLASRLFVSEPQGCFGLGRLLMASVRTLLYIYIYKQGARGKGQPPHE